MKYLLVFMISMCAFMGVTNAQEDAISKYFSKYMDDEAFTVVYLSPKLFQLLGKLELNELDDKEAAAIMEVVEDLKSLRVLTTEENAEQYYNEAIKTINTKNYETLLTVRDDGENVQFLIKDEGNTINELLLLVGGADEFVMVSFVGKIDLDKISQLAKKLDVDGVEHLDKLNEREKKSN
jgi:predicted transcriptional regulator